jgi:putative DNA primase/helicase
VFGASVNDVVFLADPTGNRRFWTIPVVGFPVDPGLDMQQVWAEVLELYRAGERWYLSMDQAGLLGEHNADFTVVDPIDERIAAGFCWGEGVQCWDWATATEVLMRIKVQEPSKNQTITASRVLQKLNGGQRKKSNGKVLFAIPSAVNEFLG